MKWTEYHEEALQEILDGARWYQSQRRGLGDEFLNEVARAMEAAAQSPDRWPPHIGKTRRCPLHGFPYAVVYLVRADSIAVVAVAHYSRRPGYWRHRTA